MINVTINTVNKVEKVLLDNKNTLLTRSYIAKQLKCGYSSVVAALVYLVKKGIVTEVKTQTGLMYRWGNNGQS